MIYQLWTQHVLPPYQALRLLSTSDDISIDQSLVEWLSGKTDCRVLEDHEQFLLCSEDSKHFQQPTAKEPISDD